MVIVVAIICPGEDRGIHGGCSPGQFPSSPGQRADRGGPGGSSHLGESGPGVCIYTTYRQIKIPTIYIITELDHR